MMGGPRQTESGDRVQVVVRVRPAMEQDGTDSPALTCNMAKRRVQAGFHPNCAISFTSIV